jgi:hypothetical protein
MKRQPTVRKSPAEIEFINGSLKIETEKDPDNLDDQNSLIDGLYETSKNYVIK